jgi:glycerol-3-phosphate dehydrogenase
LKTRQDVWDALRKQPELSVLIIGGGINGIGLLRELALQGVDVLLIDRADFCNGASAASTRIIHGGLRYLENGEFRLVRESVLERNRLLVNAPHYVRPLPTTIPIFNWISGMVPAAKRFFGLKSRPANRGAALIKAGLSMYDFYTRGQPLMPRHYFTGRDHALGERPDLNPYIVCTATYYDARIAYPERLCLELALDAEAATPRAHALNYVSVAGAQGGTITLYDEVSKSVRPVRPKIVVNATGAWIDFTNERLERKTEMIGGTKGSHLVIDHPDLWHACDGHMMYYENLDGRICIFYPFYDKVIVGSTDLPVDDPDKAVCDEDETEYLLHSTRQVFPHIDLDRSHIVFRFCGVRPLPRSDANTPGQISRDHSAPLVPPGDGIDFPVYSLVGGKWTTFRAFSEHVADTLLDNLRVDRRARTETLAIGGGKGYPRTDDAKAKWIKTQSAKTGVSAERMTVLLDRYGTRAETIAAYLAAGPDEPLRHQPDYSRREIRFLAENERVIHLDDVILRRTLIGMLGETTYPLLEEIAAIIAPVLGWSEAEQRAEISRTQRLFQRVHSVMLEDEREAVN